VSYLLFENGRLCYTLDRSVNFRYLAQSLERHSCSRDFMMDLALHY